MARLELRLTPEQKQALWEDARAQGKTASDLAKERLFGGRLPVDERLEAIELRIVTIESRLGI